MFTKTLAITLMSLAAGSALAYEGIDLPVSNFTSTLTRADVQADVLHARAAGLVAHGDKTVIATPVGMAKTRAQVRAETLEAIRLGAISQGEQSSFPTLLQLQRIEMAGQLALQVMVAAR